jgi:hypothetical protein
VISGEENKCPGVNIRPLSEAFNMRAEPVEAHPSTSSGHKIAEPPTRPDVRSRWLDTLATMIDRTDVHGLLLGRIVRLLLDADRLFDVPVRLARALSAGVPAADKAAWVDGFFSDGALLLVHDAELRRLLDEWVSHLDEAQFVDMLPLLRRTFGTFAPAERRAIAERIALGTRSVDRQLSEEVDLELAAPALATVDLILGGCHG